MTTGDDSTLPSGSDERSKMGGQFKDAEAEAKPYVGSDDSDDADDQSDDAVAAGADPDKQDTRDGAELTDAALPGVAAATGLRRG